MMYGERVWKGKETIRSGDQTETQTHIYYPPLPKQYSQISFNFYSIYSWQLHFWTSSFEREKVIKR